MCDNLGAQSLYSERFYASARAVIRSLESQFAREVGAVAIASNMMERGSSVVECRTRNLVRIPFATVSKFGHFRSLHDASVHSAVLMSTWL